MQAASVDWAGWMGLVRSDAERERLDRAKIGWLEAFVLHDAPRERLQLAADWTTLFCLLDDWVELGLLGPVDLSAYLAGLLGAFRGGEAPRNDAFRRGLVDLGERMLAMAGKAWTARFADCLEELFAAFVWEDINRWKDIRPSHSAYHIMRPITVGLRPQFALAELAESIDLSDSVRTHQEVIRLEATASRAVGWANDLFTYGKELEAGEVHNLVLVLMDTERLPLTDAVRRTTAVHDDEVRTFLSGVARLRDFGTEAPSVDRYVTVLRRWIRGHLDWAVETGRYDPCRLSHVAEVG